MKSTLIFSAIFALQLWFLSQSTLFIAPEFSLYPYLANQGLLPYRQIIDQHFPLLFFGPLHLGQVNLASPQTLIGVLIGLIGVIHFCFWQLAKKQLKNLSERIFLQLGLVIGLVLLAVNHLWLETFALGSILAGMYLQQKNQWLTGILWALGGITRPLLGPFLLLLWWRTKFPRQVVYGGVIVILIVGWWMSAHQLWPEFFELLRFNGQYYRQLASRLPDRGELIRLTWVIGWLALVTKKPKSWMYLAGLISLLPSFPRFELYHNLLLLTLPVWPQVKLKLGRAALLWLVMGIVLAARLISREPNINFFYPAELYQQAAAVDRYQATEVYFFGGPDQLYYLTNTLPPGDFYLPSLPWYHANEVWVERQIRALATHPAALVVVNTQSQLADQYLLHYSQRLYGYITANYQLREKVGVLEIWSKTPALAYENRH